MKKIALLDLGGVVFQSTGISNEQTHWSIISQLNDKYGHELNIGQDIFPDFLEEYNKRTKQRLSGQQFLKAVFDTLEINTELIEFLKEKNDIIIVSDNYRENIEYISKRYHFDHWAIKQIYSFDYGMVKSDPMFFAKVSAELEAYDKTTIVFIDDSQHKIESAEKHGFKGIRYQNNDQIKIALEECRKSK